MTMPTFAAIGTVTLALCLTTGCNRPGEAACAALTDAYVAKIATECGLGTEEDVRAIIMSNILADGARGCEDIDKVRDEDSFYDECIPAIESATCDEILSLDPPSCREQLFFVIN